MSASRMVSVPITRIPSSSPPRRMISKKRDISHAVVTMLAAGTIPVRKRGSLVSLTRLSTPTPNARVSRLDNGGAVGGPVT